jgi:1,4-alpha-glucan branching enzyme
VVASPEAIYAISAIHLLLPQIPMLFMGEEWNATQPFPFFSSFGGDLAQAVREGRRQEFAKFPEFQDAATRARIPDPEAEATFLSAKLQWQDLSVAEHAAWHERYRRLLAVRRDVIVPLLPTVIGRAGRYRTVAPQAVIVQWEFAGGVLELAANLSAQAAAGFPANPSARFWQEGEVDDQGRMGPWSVAWRVTRERIS